ncbi:MAG TPA: DUF6146 family protein [Flavobacterium sp.]|nr:DUF6146 family protein [Flavobacterium sp.]
MKKLIFPLFILLFALSCKPTQKTFSKTDKPTAANDTVRIANDSLEYEVIIVDPGFSTWLATTAQPRNYYSQSYLESKNRTYVTEWNNRVMQPRRYSPSMYDMTINYNFTTNYGYEVNYLIYNYFIYFQNKYNQKLAGYVPTR